MAEVLAELSRVRQLMEHSSCALEALQRQSDAAFHTVHARLALLEGRTKLLEVSAASDAAVPPRAASDGLPATSAAAAGGSTAAAPPPQLPPPKAAPPSGIPFIDAATPPRTGGGRLHVSAAAESDSASAMGEASLGAATQMVVATCKGAYSQYLSTQAFIADISRKFNETQDLLHKASIGVDDAA